MRKTKVLFFAADPRLARPRGETLELDEELRQIRKRVKAARYGHRLVFEPHGAARADDLIDMLDGTDAQVMHFSGHGGSQGLVLVGRGGQTAHPVDAAALRQLFRTYQGSAIRLAVLSACSSHAEAQAIAEVVGCAIGTSSKISDDAAITFSSRFYQAVANGESVQRAFDVASMALLVHRIPRSEYPELLTRKGVDPADLVLVKTVRLVPARVAAAGVTCAITAAAVFTGIFEQKVAPELTISDVACGRESSAGGIQPLAGLRGASSTTPADPDGPEARLADAKAFYRVRNYAEAASAFERAASAGNGEAMGCLGYMYVSGRGMEPKPSTGIEWLRKAAREERDAHAMYALAMAYLNGDGEERNDYQGREWLRKAVEERGHAESMRSLGNLAQLEMNDSGYRQALEWYREAVRAGSMDARVDLGFMYEKGLGTVRDPAAAFQEYHTAARAGLPRGMFAVGQVYQKGVGVPQDYAQAMMWYRRAAKAGSAEAMNSIGVLYENGLGVRRSHARAIRWYERAAEAGSPLARGNLAALGRD